MREQIFDVIKGSINGTEKITEDATFLKIGVDSVDFISMIIALEEEFGIRFEDMQLVCDDYKTIGQLVCVVEQLIENRKKYNVK